MTVYETVYDAEVAVLAGVPEVKILAPTEDGLDVKCLGVMPMKNVISRLLILSHRLRYDIDLVHAEAMHWTRLAAGARRAWSIREHQSRVWKAKKELEFRKDPGTTGWGQGGRVSSEQVEVAYRTDPEYGAVAARVEEAEETTNILEGISKLFRDKAEMLRTEVRRVGDGSLQRLSP